MFENNDKVITKSPEKFGYDSRYCYFIYKDLCFLYNTSADELYMLGYYPPIKGYRRGVKSIGKFRTKDESLLEKRILKRCDQAIKKPPPEIVRVNVCNHQLEMFDAYISSFLPYSPKYTPANRAGTRVRILERITITVDWEHLAIQDLTLSIPKMKRDKLNKSMDMLLNSYPEINFRVSFNTGFNNVRDVSIIGNIFGTIGAYDLEDLWNNLKVLPITRSLMAQAMKAKLIK